MKLQLASDLHVEFQFDFAKTGIDFTNSLLPVTDADVIVLAGDIWYGKYSIEYAAELSRQHSKPIILVFGNHDYWGVSRALYTSIDVKLKENRALVNQINETEKCEVYFLENDAVIFDDVRFLGCTLWTDYSNGDLKVMAQCRHQMNDTHAIAKKDGDPKALYERHLESKAWLESELQEPFDGKTVMVTHHAPSALSLKGSDEAVTPVDYAYFSNHEPLMKSEHAPDFWFHGHVHERRDYHVGNTRVVCNPHGYKGKDLVDDFEHELVIEV